MQVTIASIQTNAPKMGTVQTSDGQKLGFWKSELTKLGLAGGGTYEIETAPFHDRTIIVKAKLVAAAPPPATNGNGHYPQQSPSQAAAFRTPEQMFITEILTAYIGAGKCANPAELKDTIVKLREAWRMTFGFDDRAFAASEAGHHNTKAA